MNVIRRRFLVVALLSVAALGLADPAQAQYNPYAFYQNQMARQYYAQQAYWQSAYFNNPGFYQTPAYASAAQSLGIAPLANPYGNIANPYSSQLYYDPYHYNPYTAYSAGHVFSGASDLVRSFGDSLVTTEQARLMREQYNQARIDTKKKAFELDMYIRMNTPTYTEEQARVMKHTLKRIQNFSTPGEISSGRSLNFLIQDLSLYPGKKISADNTLLSEGMLAQLNVTKNTFGLGILRNEGRVTWPTALRELLTTKQRQDLEAQIQAMAKSAMKGPVDVNILRDVRTEMDRIRDDLVKKVNEISTPTYLDAKRWLNEFDEARIALEKGDGQVQMHYQKFLAGGKSVQEVADFMIANGYKFGPATAQDENAYRAFHALLASYDVVMNSHYGNNKE